MKRTHARRTEPQHGIDLRTSTAFGSAVVGLGLFALLVASSYPQLAVGIAIGLALIPLFRRAKRAALAYRDRFATTRGAESARGRTRESTHR